MPSFALALCLALAAGCSKAKHSAAAANSTDSAANASGSNPAATSLPKPANNASGSANAPTLASFAGTWHADCIADASVPNQFITTTQTITAIGLVSIQTTYFTDKSCTTPIIQSNALNKLDITAPGIAAAAEVTSTTQSLTTKILLASTLATYQAAGSSASAPSPGCDPTTWKLNEPADVTACNVKVTYNLMKIVDGKLLFGLNDATHNGLSPATRPIALDPVSALKPVDSASVNAAGS